MNPILGTDKIIFNVFLIKINYMIYFLKKVFLTQKFKIKKYIITNFKKDDQIFIYNNNFFYESWNNLSLK